MNINIKMLVGVSIPIIIRKGNLSATAKIKNIYLDKTDNIPNLKFIIARTGNKSLRGDLKIKIDNKVIATIKELSIYLSVNERIISLSLYKDIEKSIPFSYQELLKKEIVIEYSETKNNKEIILANEKYTIKN
jgi:hypothetical protein